jgi:hypothetical protein
MNKQELIYTGLLMKYLIDDDETTAERKDVNHAKKKKECKTYGRNEG